MAQQRAPPENAAKPSAAMMSHKFHIRSHTSHISHSNHRGKPATTGSMATLGFGLRREQTIYSMCNENYVKVEAVPMVNRPRTAQAVSDAFRNLGLPSRNPPPPTQGKVQTNRSTNHGLLVCRLDRKSEVSKTKASPGLALQGRAVAGNIMGRDALRMSTPSPPLDDDDDELDAPGPNSAKPGVDEIKKRLYTRECTKLGVTPVGAFLRAPSRTVLQLPNYSLGAAGARALSVPLMLDSTLTTLDLEGNGLGHEGVVNLREVLTDHCAITHLNLTRNQLGYKGALVICQILHTNRLINSLNVSANQIADKAGIFFANMLKTNRQLKTLDLSDNHLAEVAGRQLGSALSQNETLESLDLSWNHFSGAGAVKLLEGVTENIGLKHLTLAYNCFGWGRGDRAPEHLSNVLRSNTALLSLDLSSNRLLDLDVFTVARGVSTNESLETLKIGRNLVSVTATNALLAAVLVNEMSKVKLVDMQDLPISESDVAKVEELRSREVKVIHGRVHQTETDFESQPSSRSNRPMSADDQGEASTTPVANENENENGAAATATYVSTSEKVVLSEGQGENARQ